MAKISEAKQVADAVMAARADWLANPLARLIVVEDIRAELGDDHTGDASVFLEVVLRDSTRAQDWTSKNLNPLITLLSERIADAGVARMVYTRFVRKADLSEAA
ncbi:MAG: hypothetical protein ACKVS8_12060 [Phycisphaerales bacterium]